MLIHIHATRQTKAANEEERKSTAQIVFFCSFEFEAIFSVNRCEILRKNESQVESSSSSKYARMINQTQYTKNTRRTASLMNAHNEKFLSTKAPFMMRINSNC